jgi:hypothetical protein
VFVVLSQLRIASAIVQSTYLVAVGVGDRLALDPDLFMRHLVLILLALAVGLTEQMTSCMSCLTWRLMPRARRNTLPIHREPRERPACI